MRILFLQSYLGRREPPVAPLGLAVLAAGLPNHEVRIFDPNIAADPVADSRRIVSEFQPEVIGISLRNVDTTKYSDQFFYFPVFQEYVKAVRQWAPKAMMVVGGGGFSLYPQAVMERTPQIDVGFYLEADLTFPQFLRRGLQVEGIGGIYYRQNGQLQFTGKPPLPVLDELEKPRWDLVGLPAYTPFSSRAAIGIEGKRGCAMTCTYCTYPLLNGAQVRLKAPGRIVDELEILQRQYGVERVFFCDPVFNYPLEHATTVCQEILDRNLTIRWGAYHQDRFLTADDIELARRAGCDEFYMSPDAAHQNALKTLGKATTKQSLRHSLDLIARNKQAKASYNFFATTPGSGWRELFPILWFLVKARLKLRSRLLRTKLSYIRLEPGTPLVNRIQQNHTPEQELNLLPESFMGLNRTFWRTSRSRCLNLLLLVHYRLGKRFGRRNLLT